LLFLHITTMVAGVTVSFGSTLGIHLARRSDEMSAMRSAAVAFRPIGTLIPILFLAGRLFGLLTAISFGFDMVVKPFS